MIDREQPSANREQRDDGVGAEQKQAAHSKVLTWIAARIWGLTLATTVILIVSGVFGFFARLHWLADLCANLRIQQMIGLVAVILVTLVLRKWRWLIVDLAILAIHALWFVPAFTSASSFADSNLGKVDLTVMVANVYTPNREHELILDEIRSADPDVFAILELGTPLYGVLEREMVGKYPHRIAAPQDDGNFGIAVYSRHPLAEMERFVLNHDSIETISVVVDKSDQRYQVVATHPLPPMGDRGFRSRNEHLRQLAQRIRQSDSSDPTIVVGDFNLTPWSPVMSDFESNAGLDRAGRGWGVTPTWYAKPLFPFGLMIDHAFISEDLECISHQTGNFMGSDHRAVIVGVKRKE